MPIYKPLFSELWLLAGEMYSECHKDKPEDRINREQCCSRDQEFMQCGVKCGLMRLYCMEERQRQAGDTRFLVQMRQYGQCDGANQSVYARLVELFRNADMKTNIAALNGWFIDASA